MFINQLQIPPILEKLEALKRRLPVSHPKWNTIQEEWARRYAGFRGEKTVYYYLSLLDDHPYHIFHGLRLANGSHFFQMDFLLLTTRYALIIETKNIAGELLFDEQGQLIRTINSKTDGYSDPVAQAQHHQRSLRKWLKAHHFPPLPVDYVVIISQPSSIIKMERSDPAVRQRVQPVSGLHNFIFRCDGAYKREVLDAKGLRKLGRLLIKKNVPLETDVLKDFGLTENDLLTGVECPKCGTVPMVELKAWWKCPDCGFHSKDAPIQGINDYFLLISPTFTNSQIRDFLLLSSRQKTRRMLAAVNVPFKGENKARVYFYKPD
ncbi:NERD domain-containing protein [Bacillus sp. FJAT-27251]|uniref:NERD domain-containing protein n=1 Tax=Bacillus sp. FJAT-27251 TaxID=1684142 RepID=UPI0006A7C93C|nr:NERD domain-containing protein [Bacillus sp. FJAT-27251]